MMILAAPQNGVVSLAFSSDFLRLELVWINTQSGQIINAGYIPISSVDLTTRTILVPDDFMESVQSLFQELNIPPNLPVTLMLPSFYTRMLGLPPGINEKDLHNILVSEAERSVLFKREAPTLDWLFLNMEDAENEYCIYTAYPLSALTEILSILNQLKINLCSIESNVTAVLKGLISTGTLANDGQKRLLSILNESNSTTLVLEGVNITSLIEAPVSSQNIDASDIVSDLQQDTGGLSDLLHDCKEVIVVHNNSKVPADLLATAFEQFDEVVLVEQNADTIASLGAKKPLYPCTVEALGAAMFKELASFGSLNLLPKERQIEVMVADYRVKILPFAIAANVVVLALVVLAYGVLSAINLGKSMSLDEVNKKIANHKAPDVSPETYAKELWLKRYSDFNVNIVKWLTAVQKDLPSTLWINSVSLQCVNGKSFLRLEGGSQNGQEIAGYFQKIQPTFLADKLNYSNVEPTSLSVTPSLIPFKPVTTPPPAGGSSGGLDKATSADVYYKWQAQAGTDPSAVPVAPAAAPPPPPASPAPASH
jgi:serine/threonine protein kinase